MLGRDIILCAIRKSTRETMAILREKEGRMGKHTMYCSKKIGFRQLKD